MTEEQYKAIENLIQGNIVILVFIFLFVGLIFCGLAAKRIEELNEKKEKELKDKIKREMEKNK